MTEEEPRDPGRQRLGEIARGAVLLLALFPLLPPLRGDAPPTWALGEVAPRAVVAEFDFPVLRDRSEFEAELRRLRGEIPALLAVSDTARAGARQRLESLRSRVETLRATWDPSGPDSLALGYDPETSLALVLGEKGPGLLDLAGDLAREVERRGLISTALGRELEPFASVTIVGEGDPFHVSRQRLLTPGALRDSATVAARTRHLPVGPTLALVDALFSPNLLWQKAETERLVEAAGSTLPRHRRFVRRGEKIVGANEVVSADAALALESYAFWWGAEDRRGSALSGWLDRAGRLLLAGTMIGILFAVLPLGDGSGPERFAPRPPRGLLGERTLFTLILVVGLAVGFLLRRGGLSPYLFPTVGVSLAGCLLLGKAPGLLAALLFTTLVALPGGAGFSAWVVLLSGGSIAAMVPARNPAELARSAGFAAGVQALTLVALFGAGLAARPTLGADLTVATLGPFLGAALAWAGVASVERRARWLTPLGVGEITSLDHPLLARLQVEAPGTYAHSVRVATLADAAARAIGADGRLARAIGYHHDIGKLARPGEFPENGGSRPDEVRGRLLREMHVREGVALAVEARLPRTVVQGIAEHHGLELGADAARPSFRESALVLIANRVVRVDISSGGSGPDAVEAVLEPERMLEELEASGLRLADLGRIRETMLALYRGWNRTGEDSGGR